VVFNKQEATAWYNAAVAAACCFYRKRTFINRKVIINTDGAARGNPGPAAIGCTIKDEWGNLIASLCQRIGRATNNEAEYFAVIKVLEKAIASGAKHVEIKSDSELVVKQINGKYRVKKATLKPLYQKVVQLIASLENFVITYVPREQNREADKLANKALDSN
jgi:ribonuclease HI